MNKFNEILDCYSIYKKEIQETLQQFKQVPQSDYFYELCYCLLTPSTQAINALHTVKQLKEKSFFEKPFNPAHILSNKKHYIRFHNTKAKRLLRAKEIWDQIEQVILANESVYSKREQLVRLVDGFGFKEASHFLRNIGYSGIAILDRHILRNLSNYGVIDSEYKISTPKKYLAVESKFLEFSKTIGITLEELDLLFWAKETGFVLK
jgi:N-glycosylase/DNA lyase